MKTPFLTQHYVMIAFKQVPILIHIPKNICADFAWLL